MHNMGPSIRFELGPPSIIGKGQVFPWPIIVSRETFDQSESLELFLLDSYGQREAKEYKRVIKRYGDTIFAIYSSVKIPDFGSYRFAVRTVFESKHTLTVLESLSDQFEVASRVTECPELASEKVALVNGLCTTRFIKPRYPLITKLSFVCQPVINPRPDGCFMELAIVRVEHWPKNLYQNFVVKLEIVGSGHGKPNSRPELLGTCERPLKTLAGDNPEQSNHDVELPYRYAVFSDIRIQVSQETWIYKLRASVQQEGSVDLVAVAPSSTFTLPQLVMSPPNGRKLFHKLFSSCSPLSSF
ncbi:hypothetical protein F4810DRAFT_685080 [Camillea tinctor]|nr:hypothetical protein F4810DRAFT_685080 [Camillea tinctor]